MPGFKVQLIGGDKYEGIAPTGKYYYTYHWTIEQLFGDYLRNSSVTISAKEMSLPTFTVAKESITGGSLEYKYAKSVSYNDVSITWYDTLGMIDIIKKWRKSVWDPESGLAVAEQYKKTTRQRQYLPYEEGEKGDVSYVLYGSWPSTIKYGDLTYVNSDVKIIDVSITYDYAIETFKR